MTKLRVFQVMGKHILELKQIGFPGGELLHAKDNLAVVLFELIDPDVETDLASVKYFALFVIWSKAWPVSLSLRVLSSPFMRLMRLSEQVAI